MKDAQDNVPVGVVMLMVPKTFNQIQDEEGLCGYCLETDRGRRAEYGTPDGYVCCEGAYCTDAYKTYLEEIESSETIVKIKARTKVTIERG